MSRIDGWFPPNRAASATQDRAGLILEAVTTLKEETGGLCETDEFVVATDRFVVAARRLELFPEAFAFRLSVRWRPPLDFRLDGLRDHAVPDTWLAGARTGVLPDDMFRLAVRTTRGRCLHANASSLVVRGPGEDLVILESSAGSHAADMDVFGSTHADELPEAIAVAWPAAMGEELAIAELDQGRLAGARARSRSFFSDSGEAP